MRMVGNSLKFFFLHPPRHPFSLPPYLLGSLSLHLSHHSSSPAGRCPSSRPGSAGGAPEQLALAGGAARPGGWRPGVAKSGGRRGPARWAGARRGQIWREAQPSPAGGGSAWPGPGGGCSTGPWQRRRGQSWQGRSFGPQQTATRAA